MSDKYTVPVYIGKSDRQNETQQLIHYRIIAAILVCKAAQHDSNSLTVTAAVLL